MKYKFLDIGCKKGSSFCIGKSFGYKVEEGLGIDINMNFVKEAKENGYNAEYGDITQKLPYQDGEFELVVASHVMEHLPNRDLFLAALDEMLRLSSKYLFISFPVFDNDEYLNSLGLKTFYSDWTGHTCMVHLSELQMMLSSYQYDLKMITPITDSSAKEIHPINSPRDQHEYDSSIHPHKTFIVFDRPMYREFRLTVRK